MGFFLRTKKPGEVKLHQELLKGCKDVLPAVLMEHMMSIPGLLLFSLCPNSDFSSDEPRWC